ncbi:MAG: hypothetical protein JO306_01865 [Gemmatimonadetes bacterium]|nr:hypothetical protein [Gemmatimonadota bacterium]
MKKMTLDLGSLRVESFAAETPADARGTVHAEAASKASNCATACLTCVNCSSYPDACFCTEVPGCF